jgi:hypothetical protein
MFRHSQNKKTMPAHAGGVRNGRVFNFSELDSSSSEEEETPRLPAEEHMAAWCAQPLYRAMCGDDAPWGDILAMEEEGRPIDLEALAAAAASDRADKALRSARREARRECEAQAALERWQRAESDIWAGAWGRNLELHTPEVYDLSGLSDEEYGALMTWLYAEGWDAAGDRDTMRACPAGLPPRVWVQVRDFGSLMPLEEEKTVAAPAPAPAKPKGKGCVPRFCRASSGGVPCAEAKCRYVHDDTMPRLDEPCAFGAACGASDPAKRALCIRMHPGELWTPDLVVRRA